MAEFNRKELKKIFEAAEIEVPKDVLTSLCELHTGSLDGLNDSVKDLKDRLEQAEQERDTYKAKAPKDGEETVTKKEYDTLKKQYDDYKAEQETKETRAAKEKAIRDLYKAAGISEKRIDAVVKVTDIDSIELDNDGKIKDADKRTESAKTEWSDFIETTSTKGANTANPPANNGGSGAKSKEDILAIKDGAERRKAMSENPELFGIEKTS